jgi:general L-amino acid transport system permease protein
MTDLMSSTVHFVRASVIEEQKPPTRLSGPLLWLRENLFSSWLNSILTLVFVSGVAWVLPDLIHFTLVIPVWFAASSKDCSAELLGHPVGACWGFVNAHFGYFLYGQYPDSERWRVDLFYGLESFGIFWILYPKVPFKSAGLTFFFIVFPVVGFTLLSGMPSIGLPTVQTHFWGGFLVTIVISTVGIVASLPIGILLALGRRSGMPIARMVSVIMIEFVRGVPLITVLFMANVMFPLFVPDGWRPDSLLRVLVGVGLFSAAYMAEAVRGGLQAIPRGQYEAAQALGLGYWQMMIKIILPQALKIVIPNIVNNFIGLFKDTTLVAIVGIFDFLRTIQASLSDPNWRSSTMPLAAYLFAALVYFIFCYGMASYSLAMERRLHSGNRH